MKLPIFLSTLLLSASPVLADDLIYLQCDANTQIRIRDKTSMKLLREESEEFVVNYRINIKKKVIVDSGDGVERSFEILKKGLLVQRITAQDGSNRAEVDTYIQYDPPGRMKGNSYFTDDTEEGTGKGEGKCKASNASVYEASK
tara:strand:- start:623 stop:1054 length:432 start_codon:yes stop_codon:yes gene_type:complete